MLSCMSAPAESQVKMKTIKNKKAIHIVEAVVIFFEVIIILFSSGKRLNHSGTVSDATETKEADSAADIVSQDAETDAEKTGIFMVNLREKLRNFKRDRNRMYLMLPAGVSDEDLHVIQTGESGNEFWIHEKSSPMDPNFIIHVQAGQNSSLELLIQNDDPEMTQEASYLTIFDGDVCFVYRLFAICMGKKDLEDDYDFYDRNDYNEFVEDIFSSGAENIWCNQDLKEPVMESWHTLTIEAEYGNTTLWVLGYLLGADIE